MSTVPPVVPVLRRLAARTAVAAAAWQPRLGHAVRTHAAPLRALAAPRQGTPQGTAQGTSQGAGQDGPQHGRHRAEREQAVAAAGAAAVLLAGALLVASPGSASAQTVRPTTPGSSAFTAAQAAVPSAGLVQVAVPSAYKLPDEGDSAQEFVAVAANLVPVEPAGPGAAPAEHPEPQPEPEAPAAPAWSAPAPGAPTSNPYGKANSAYAAGYHTGVDFAVSPGTPLLAVGEATVVSAGWDGAYGKEVVLRLADGHYAQYAHLSSVAVSAGQRVSAGERIGASGSTGNSTGPHLHFEIRTSNRYGAVVNPIAYLADHGVTAF
ncbi:M23 family metallopeptidase [Kitasatospora sp. NPDC101183]|uniref:M23 family metallopeptidase n=1 Tax=Kitasatospora sp. NPDC101183 TaxID=3364100 RepID=UPI00382CF90F